MATTNKEELVIVENNNPNQTQQQANNNNNTTANVYQNTMQQVNTANNNSGVNYSTDEYYNNLRSENYKALLNKEIQLNNAKQNALKATNNQLASMGMANSGYGAIQSTGIANNYLNAMGNAQQDYINNQNTINEQQRKEEITANENNFNSMVSVLNQAEDSASLTTALSNYGINYDPNTGTMSGEGWDKLDNNQKNNLLAAVNMRNQSMQNNEWINNNTADGVAYADSGSAIASVTDNYGEKGNTTNELRYIYSDSYMGSCPDGKVVKLVNGKHNDHYVYMIKKGNAWYKTTGNVYSKAKDKEEIKGK